MALPAAVPGLSDAPFYAATAVGLIPLLAVAGRRLPWPWWAMAAGFGVSVLADLAGWAGHGALASQVYPVTQAACFALALAGSGTELVVAAVLAAAGVSIALRGGDGLDVALHVTAWGSVAALAWRNLSPGTLRTALAAGFGGMLLAWGWYVAAPGWVSWGALQSVRLMTAAGFAVAAWQAAPAGGNDGAMA